jgi:hypothetical protein
MVQHFSSAKICIFESATYPSVSGKYDFKPLIFLPPFVSSHALRCLRFSAAALVSAGNF